MEYFKIQESLTLDRVFGIESSQISLSNFAENLLPRRVCNNDETVASKITPNFNVKGNQSSRWVNRISNLAQLRGTSYFHEYTLLHNYSF